VIKTEDTIKTGFVDLLRATKGRGRVVLKEWQKDAEAH
jgi:hypothetical protein